jgi:DNA-binding transcriptional ArsR family regulator
MKDHSYVFFFKALANETRMNIINALKEHKHANVSELCEELDLEQSRVSHNLKCLVFCGFVKNSRDGKNVIYSLNKDAVNPILKVANRHVEKYAKNLRECKVLKY